MDNLLAITIKTPDDHEKIVELSEIVIKIAKLEEKENGETESTD